MTKHFILSFCQVSHMIKVLDDACRHTSHHAIGWHVFDYHGVGSDENIVANGYASYYLGAAAYLHIVANHWGTQVMVEAYGDLLINFAVPAYLLG